MDASCAEHLCGCCGSRLLAGGRARADAGARRAGTLGWNGVTIRGERQDLYHLPARGTLLHHSVIFVPGVGGWKGWAITVGETMASWGYEVSHGLDTKTYLDRFTKHGQLTEADVARDFCMIANWTTGGLEAASASSAGRKVPG